jgi:hypothetical protein
VTLPFYTRDGERFLATVSTRGPWSNDHQHAGPPSALLVRAFERHAPGMRLARINCEMRRPIPIGSCLVETSVERAGRKSVVVSGQLSVNSDVVLTARALLLREIESPVVAHEAPPQRGPLEFAPYSFTFFRSSVGYHTAVEVRLVSGAFGSGRMACWMRQRAALVEGEAPSGAQRVLVLADAGSGVSAALDITRYTFLNADLSVHLQRPTSGEWLLLDAATSSSGNGSALADSKLSDERGFVGRGLQSLVVDIAT